MYEYASYHEAQRLVLAAGITTQAGYNKWYKSAGIRLPSLPKSVYSDEWISWPVFFNKEKLPTIPYSEAKSYIQAINPKIRTRTMFYDFIKTNTGELPVGFPINPINAYKDIWESTGKWNGFLGTNNANKPRNITPMSYEEAKDYISTVACDNPKTLRWFREWYKENKSVLPWSFPGNPPVLYKDTWLAFGGWSGFLNTTTRSNKLIRDTRMSYIDAKSLIGSIHPKIDTNLKYMTWYNENKDGIACNMPSNPSISYVAEWISWPEFLGTYTEWRKDALLKYLKSLKPLLHSMTVQDLYILLDQKCTLRAINRLSGNNIMSFISNTKNNPDEFLTLVEESVEPVELDSISTEYFLNHTVTIDELTSESVNTVQSFTVMECVDFFDAFDNSIISSDAETIEYFINSKIQSTWNHLLNIPPDEMESEINELTNRAGGEYYTEYKTRFLEQYNGAINLETPDGYDYPYKPLLMQQLIAYLVNTKYRVGNWSGTGAGKTLGAIIASRVANAKFTVIISINNTIITNRDNENGWKYEIERSFPEFCNVIVKEKTDIQLHPVKPNYLLLNYEAFSLNADLVDYLLDNHSIDMIILDEIHATKLNIDKETRRRININRFLKQASDKNPQCKILGMTATPVINNLDEAKSLIEMVTGVEYPELSAKPTLVNALAIHKHLVLNGIRWKPKYDLMHVNEKMIEISGDDVLASKLLEVGSTGNVLKLESALLPYKMETLISNLKPGTIVYTYYVDDDAIMNPLKSAITNAGYSYATYTGNDTEFAKHANIGRFKRRAVDILIGSSAIGTGVDGLQHVCDRVIVLIAPWTSAAYEQLIGRVCRYGSNFTNIDIIIPQVQLNHDGDIWSWDRYRFGKILYKKTITDTAVDGIIPEGKMMTEKQLLKSAMDSLDSWIDRIENDGISSISRNPVIVSTLPESIETTPNIRRYGELSQMNRHYCVRKSSTLHAELVKDPTFFYEYHTEFRKVKETWGDDIPHRIIANKIKNHGMTDWVVADFGCGDALLAREIPNITYSFDHVAVDDTVIACDISKTPLEDRSVDLAVFSLSLIGVNWKDYLKESFRVTKTDGYIIVAETITRDNHFNFQDTIQEMGYADIQSTHSACGRFVFITARKSKPLVSFF